MHHGSCAALASKRGSGIGPGAGGLLDEKRAAEQALRDTGASYAVARPTGLGPANMSFDQGIVTEPSTEPRPERRLAGGASGGLSGRCGCGQNLAPRPGLHVLQPGFWSAASTAKYGGRMRNLNNTLRNLPFHPSPSVQQPGWCSCLRLPEHVDSCDRFAKLGSFSLWSFPSLRPASCARTRKQNLCLP